MPLTSKYWYLPTSWTSFAGHTKLEPLLLLNEIKIWTNITARVSFFVQYIWQNFGSRGLREILWNASINVPYPTKAVYVTSIALLFTSIYKKQSPWKFLIILDQKYIEWKLKMIHFPLLKNSYYLTSLW